MGLAEFRQSLSGTNRTLVAAVSGALIVLALVLIVVYRVRASRGTAGLSHAERLGKTLARETVQSLGGSGKILVWRAQAPTGVVDMRANTVEAAVVADTFLKELASNAGVEVTKTLDEPFNPNAVELSKDSSLEPTRFAELLRRNKSLDAIVLVGAVPQLTPEQCAKLPVPRPKVLAAVCMGNAPRHLLAKGVVQVLIAARMEHPTMTKPPKTPEEWFDFTYAVMYAPTGPGESTSTKSR